MNADIITATRLRPSAKAVLVVDGELLVTRNDTGDDGGHWFALPGGGQRPGELLPDALRREVLEETGVVVEVHELLWIREYQGADYAFARFDPGDHGIEFMFRCTAGGSAQPAAQPDDHQVGYEWVGLDRLPGIRFLPQHLIGRIVALQEGRPLGPVYLGELQ